MIEIIKPLSFVAIFFGLKSLIQAYRKQTIILFKLKDKQSTFNLIKHGDYSVYIIGGRFVKTIGNFKINIFQNFKSNINIHLKEPILKNKIYQNWRYGVEILYFTINSSGSYTININNITNLIVQEPKFMTKSNLRTTINIENIDILIKERMSANKKIFAIILIIVGLMVQISL